MKKFYGVSLIAFLAIMGLWFTSCSKDDGGNEYYQHVLKINDTTFKYHTAEYTNIADGAFYLSETEEELIYNDISFYIYNEKGRPVFDPASVIEVEENIIDNYSVIIGYSTDENYKSVSGTMKIINNNDKTITLELQNATFEYDGNIIDGKDTPKLGETIKVNGKITFTKYIM